MNKKVSISPQIKFKKVFFFRKNESKEHKFWIWFKKNSLEYFNFEKNQTELFKRLKEELNKIDVNLVFEFSQILENGKREFIISADGIKSSFSAVNNLVEKCPKFVKWEIVAFRQPRKEINQINYNDTTINFEDVFFTYTKNKGKINLKLYMKDFYESSDWTVATFILLDYVIGEYLTEMALAHIDKKKLNGVDKSKLLPISELLKIVSEYYSEFNN